LNRWGKNCLLLQQKITTQREQTLTN